MALDPAFVSWGSLPPHHHQYKGHRHPAESQETVQRSKDFVSIFLQTCEWWASPLMSLHMEAYRRHWGQEALGLN